MVRMGKRSASLWQQFAVWRDFRYNLRELSKIAEIDQNSPIIRGRIFIDCPSGWGSCSIAKNVIINSGVKSNPIGGDTCRIVFMRPEAKLTIGEGARISNVIIGVAVRVEIGSKVYLGAGCRVYDTDFHSIHLDHRVNGNIGIQANPTTICEGAFIGAFSTILKGVTIGSESVVGAGAVVTKDIPSRQIWAGNPARHVGDIDTLPQTCGKWILLNP